MYTVHQYDIEQYASQSPQNTADVLMFVRLSVRRHIELVPGEMRALRSNPREYLEKAPMLTRKAYADIRQHARHIYSLAYIDEADERTLISEIVTLISGINIIKAGFAVQLLTGRAGCLDTHNLKRFGLRYIRIRRGESFESAWGKINQYVVMCNRLGGSGALWDGWCDYVSYLRPDKFRNAEEVSRLHCTAIIGEGYNEKGPFIKTT